VCCEELLLKALSQRSSGQLGSNENSTIHVVLRQPYVFKVFPNYASGEKKICHSESGIPHQIWRTPYAGHVDSTRTKVRYFITAIDDSLDLTSASLGAVIINPSWDEDILSQQLASLNIFLSLIRIENLPALEFSIYPTPFFTPYDPEDGSKGKFSTLVIHILAGRFDFSTQTTRNLNVDEVELLWHFLGFLKPCDRLHPELISINIINWSFLALKQPEHILKFPALPLSGNWLHNYPGCKLEITSESFSIDFIYALAAIPDFPLEAIISISLQQPWRAKHGLDPKKMVECIWIQFRNKLLCFPTVPSGMTAPLHF
jgi:hypothetical protein